MKRILFLSVAFVLFALTLAQAYQTGHVFINGKVVLIAGNMITIGDATYKVDPTCKVVIAFKEHGSFHERPARLLDVARGDSVTAKKIANTLYEIMIERWK